MALTFESGHSGGTGQQLGQSYEVYGGGGGGEDARFGAYTPTSAVAQQLENEIAQTLAIEDLTQRITRLEEALTQLTFK